MATVTNKTKKPLSVPLPRGKVLHLGPGKTGEIASNAVEHPQLKALVASGALELVDQGPRHTAGGGPSTSGPASTGGHKSGGGGRRSGDR